MIYKVKLLNVNDVVEEEVEIQIDKNAISCFANVCPFEIEVNKKYVVELTPIVVNDYNVVELPEKIESEILKIGNGFKYKIIGRLVDSFLVSSGLVIKDETLEIKYAYLNGKMISVEYDRIDVEFIFECQ